MASARDLAPLVQLSQLVLDADLARLRAAAAARNASLSALATLAERGGAAPEGLSPVAAAQAELRYQSWADARRAEINTRLARQTADWLEARAVAATAFGRAEALGTLSVLAAKAAARKRQR